MSSQYYLCCQLSTVRGIAHITGGAFYNKIIRIVHYGLGVRIQKGTWPVPKIFKMIQAKGNIEDKEMFSVFNMGVGLVLVVDRKYTTRIIRRLFKLGLKSWAIGSVVKGRKTMVV